MSLSPAFASLLALLVAIVLSITTRINVGLVAIGLAWVIGVWVADLGAEAVIRGFPANLFVTLSGVALLFCCAQANGTLENVAHRAVGLARGNVRALPLLLFGIACVLSTVGPGAISTVAMIAPLAMLIGSRAGLPSMLTALMVTNGANAGNLSPVATLGVIANTKMAEAGVGGHEAKVWFANFVAHVLVSLVAWLWFVRRHASTEPAANPGPGEAAALVQVPLSRSQLITLAVVVGWIAGVLLLKLNLGLSAYAAVALLVGLRLADESAAFKLVPWRVLVMVSGVSVLIALLEATGGMELFTAFLARMATPDTVNGMIAFVTGSISLWSSTTGVVLPAFLPTVPGLVATLGGGDPLAVALSINVGSSLVDVSPLSTLGALCVAAVPNEKDAGRLFRLLLIWGLSMAVVGAIIAQLLLGPLARW